MHNTQQGRHILLTEGVTQIFKPEAGVCEQAPNILPLSQQPSLHFLYSPQG